ncbi:MAG: hypothetical protein PHN56_03690 [Candidatus Nanoarchaeia archaeon]|nr:hypothetical protein [Candidatus Nanoarchaeia archaeon]
MDYPKKWKCPNCSEIVENNKLCTKCKFRFGNHYPKLWNCPNCNNINSDTEFCKTCEYPNILSIPKLWHCYECSNLIKESFKCNVCGFELKEKKPEQEHFIEKKITKKEFIDKKNIYIASLAIILLSVILVFYSIDFSPAEEISTEILAGTSFSKDFILASNLDSVTFELQSPSGETVIVDGIKKSSNIWSISNIALNESGTWDVKITGILGISSFQSADSLEIKNSCINNSNCLTGICCNGACINVCDSNSDCDDFNSLTNDVCLNSKTCNATCINYNLICNTIAGDGFCPSNCNKDNDVDCVSCRKDEAICSGVCKKLECKSNTDCNDNNALTFDKCIIMNNECNNFCENNYYEGSCSEGKIEYNGYCVTPSCITSEDCYKEGWNYNCIDSGTINAYCSYFECNSGEIVCSQDGINKCKVPDCKRNSDCLAGQVCENAWECNAKCVGTSQISNPNACSENQYLCSDSCKEYENLCSWPNTPLDSNLCLCNLSNEYLLKKSEYVEIIPISSNQESTIYPLSILCSGCNSRTGNCFNAKKYALSYTIVYNADSSISASVLGLSKNYDHSSQSIPPQLESKNEYVYGTINCNNNNSLILSSELSASINNVRLFVEEDESVEIDLIDYTLQNIYTSNVCPAFDKAKYKISFDIDSVSGNFSIKYGLDKDNKTIILDSLQNDVISRGIVNCSLTNNNISFVSENDLSSFKISSVQLFVEGCNEDADCANNDLDKCSLTKCVNNKCQFNRINNDYCSSSEIETKIEVNPVFYSDDTYNLGSFYLENSSICENNINDGKYYIINAEVTELNGDLLVGYEADSKGTMLTINSPQRIVIAGVINCSKKYKSIIFYLPRSGFASSFNVNNFKMYIKNFEMLPYETIVTEETLTEEEEIALLDCKWPKEANITQNKCVMISNNNENTNIIKLNELETYHPMFGDKKDTDSLDLSNILCGTTNYNLKTYYLTYNLDVNGRVNLNSGVLDFSEIYYTGFEDTLYDEQKGIIKCDNYQQLVLKNEYLFDISSSKFKNAVLYVKLNE